MNNDDKILALLEQDARLTPAQIAGMMRMTEAQVTERLRVLESQRTIIGYHALIDWEKTDKEFVTALIEVRITPQKGMGFDQIARQIYTHHQVESVYLMSGGFDLTVIITGRSMKEVARFVSEQLAPMENVLSTATHFVLKKYKEKGIEFEPSARDEREVLMSW